MSVRYWVVFGVVLVVLGVVGVGYAIALAGASDD